MGISTETILRYGVPVLGALLSFVVLLVGIIIRRLYGSIDTLFRKNEFLQRQINILKLVALKEDPESTALFSALTREHDHNGHGKL